MVNPRYTNPDFDVRVLGGAKSLLYKVTVLAEGPGADHELALWSSQVALSKFRKRFGTEVMDRLLALLKEESAEGTDVLLNGWAP